MLTRELLRDCIQQRGQTREDDNYLQRKGEATRASTRADPGRSNDKVEAAFAAKRN